MTVDRTLLVELAERTASDDGLEAILVVHGLLDAEGIASVIAAAEAWAWVAPVEAGVVAERCLRICSERDWSQLTGPAEYVRARGALATGRIGDAKASLRAARLAFAEHGDTDGAARTALGLAAVEAAAGRLDVARSTLQELLDSADVVDGLITAKATQNLGGVEVMAGRFERGLALLDESARAYDDLGARREWVDAVNNRAIALIGLGRADEAIAATELALDALEDGERVDPRADLLDTSARAHLLAGSLSTAMSRFQESLSITRVDGVDERSASTLLGLADVWATLGLHLDALHDYEAVADWADANGAASMSAWARLGCGVAAAALGGPADARVALDLALAAFEDSGESGGLVNAALARAASADGGSDRDRYLELALAAADAIERPVDRACVELALHDAHGGDGHLAAAEALVAGAPAPRLRYEILVRRGRALRAAGDLDGSIDRLREAAGVIDATRGSLASERHRRTYFAGRLAAHRELVEVLLTRSAPGDVGEAFSVIERGRSRALLDAMAGLVDRPPAGITTDVIRQLSALTRDLEALQNRALGDDELRGGAAASCDLALMEARVESVRTRLGAEPASGDRLQVPVVPVGDLQAHLADAGAVLVSYHVHGDGSVLAFVVGGGELRPRRLPVVASDLVALVRRLDAQVARFRAGQSFTDRWAKRLERATTAILEEVGRALVDPIEDLIGATGRLVVVPAGEMCAVPFAAVVSRHGRLIDRFELAVAPSASAWVQCRRVSPCGGVPTVIAAADDRAPDADVEAAEVAAAFAGARLLVGADATSAALLGVEAPSILHLACHGVFHPEHSMFSALRMRDRWVTAYELADLDLTGALVVLSACESGRLAVHAGDELMGLPRAALLAGARDVVTSGWIAHDGTTASLMRRFAEAVARGAAPSAALRDAQLAVERERPHPFYWAGFTVLGAGWPSTAAERPLAGDADAAGVISPDHRTLTRGANHADDLESIA